jgi:host factor-I protein
MNSQRQKALPSEDTHQEAAYLHYLGEKQKMVRIKLMDGEIVRGWIEYYDRRMVRLTREGAPNLFIYKHDIAYIAEEGARRAAPLGSRSGMASSSGENE